MADVFAGKPDARQSADVNQKVSRFRPRYRALTDEEKALHDQMKAKAEELEALYDRIDILRGPGGRYKALAITDLEKSVMWAVKELTA